MCVCVNHLKRCKTSNLAGGHRRPIELCPTKLSMVSLGYPDIQADHLDVPASIFNIFNVNFPKWQPAKPRTGMSFFQQCSNTTTVRFSQSELLPTSSDGTVASSKDVERILLHCFSRLVIHHFLSGLLECFLHVRCIPHQ